MSPVYSRFPKVVYSEDLCALKANAVGADLFYPSRAFDSLAVRCLVLLYVSALGICVSERVVLFLRMSDYVPIFFFVLLICLLSSETTSLPSFPSLLPSIRFAFFVTKLQ